MSPRPVSLFMLALVFVAITNAHGDETMNMNMGGNLAANVTDIEDWTPSYFRHGDHSALIVAHIVIMSLAWILVLPLAVMFYLARSRYSFATQFIFLLMNGLGVLLSTVYNTKTPDLYPDNAHHTLGWILTCIVVFQTAIALIQLYTSRKEETSPLTVRGAFVPISQEAMEEHQRVHSLQGGLHCRLSNDSGQGTERNTESLRSQSISSRSDDDLTLQDVPLRPAFRSGEDMEKNGIIIPRKLNEYFRKWFSDMGSSRMFHAVLCFYSISMRLILLLGFAGLMTGAVTYAGIFRGRHIFSGLAHFIKGSVFFWYGILTLGRWAGCFSDRGWSWNLNPAKTQMLSAEFAESFLIFFYGSTNVFLEHLGSWGGAWTAQDLEHVSITIMFFGGGLCGMLIESGRIRDLLNATVLQSSLDHAPAPYSYDSTEVTPWQDPKSYRISMNPIPALIILLLGTMMSSHHQESMVSTMIHGQWGSLLIGAAFSRAATYIVFYLSPPTSFFPSRPPTELITAFCFMAGGTIFMASSADTVSAMEYNNLDAMFVFTVTMGAITLLMAWIILVIAIKGWAVRQEARQELSEITAA